MRGFDLKAYLLLKKLIEEGSNNIDINQLQSDWNQGDKTQANFIKNRTHYDQQIVVYSEVTMEPTATSTRIDLYSGKDTGIGYLYNKRRYFHPGSSLTITVNDMQFNFDEETHGSSMGWGQPLCSIGDITISTGTIMNRQSGLYSIRVDFSDIPSEPVVLTATYTYQELKKLDEKFIPNTIARVKDIESINIESDWNANENEAGYIKNKPDIATDDEIIALFMEKDMFPVVADADGFILADESNNILLW